MSSFNRVLILGRLGQTPTLKSTQGGKPFCRLNLATNNPFLNAEGTKTTSWHNVHVFGKEAENATRYLRKGRQVFVEGRIDSKSQANDNGSKTYQTFITADHLTYVGSGAGPQKDDSMPSEKNAFEDLDSQNQVKELLFGSLENIAH